MENWLELQILYSRINLQIFHYCSEKLLVNDLFEVLQEVHLTTLYHHDNSFLLFG